MRVARPSLPLLVLALLAAGCGSDPARESPRPAGTAVATESGKARSLKLKELADGLNRPVWAGAAPGDDALWVAEQPGRVLRVAGGRPRTVLDLRGQVRVGAEQGLLGIAFHPEFASGRPLLYVHHSDRRGDTRVAEYRVRRGRAVPVRDLLHVDQPEENHNGGQLAFGPDGRLHLGLGDGGGAFDRKRRAQDPKTKLGKLLATEVEGRPRWQTVLYGLRNPWRFSFDFALNELWIGDVGQDRFEEVDRVLLEPDEPPKNLGWSAYEGTRRLPGHRLRGNGELVAPVAQYGHDDGCSITGGVVYRGSKVPDLERRYVYGDYCSGAVWTLRPTPKGGATGVRRERASVPQLSHIGTDADGELLLVSGAGAVYAAVSP